MADDETTERFCEFCGKPADGMALGKKRPLQPRTVILACAEHGERAAQFIRQEEEWSVAEAYRREGYMLAVANLRSAGREMNLGISSLMADEIADILEVSAPHGGAAGGGE